MARAFIASVPLGLVLVAAVLVPIALTPGTFGFDSWPADRGHGIAARPIRVAPDHGTASVPLRVPRASAGADGSRPVASARPLRPGAAPRVSTPAQTGGGSVRAPATHTHAPSPQGGPAGPAPPQAPSPPSQPPAQDGTAAGNAQPAATVVASVDVPALHAHVAVSVPPLPGLGRSGEDGK